MYVEECMNVEDKMLSAEIYHFIIVLAELDSAGGKII